MRSAIALAVACATGMRRGEIIVRKWADIDAARGEMSVATSLDRLHGEKTTKTRQGRVVPLPQALLEVLAAWRAEFGGSPWILPSPVDAARHANADQITHAIGHVVAAHQGLTAPCEVCGLQEMGRVWMHGGRHRAASLMIQAGIDVATAADVLGHSTPTLLRVYAHGAEDRRRAAIDAIPALGAPG